MRKIMLVAAAGAALLLVPAAAQAATKDVYAGTPPKGLLKGVPPIAFDNAFYPKRVTIAAGDKVAFNILSFHNVMSLPSGIEGPMAFVPNLESPVTGVKDAAGADMWFNGQPGIVPNMEVFAPSAGKVVDGTKTVNSGVPMDGPPKPFKVRFPKKGTYTMLCAIHPGMKTKVKVKRAGAGLPSARRDAKRIKKQARAASKLAKELMAGKGTPGGDTVRAGNDRKGVATLAFFPDSATVKAGEAVSFEMSKNSSEIHNVAFGPEEYIGGLAQSFFGPAGMDPMTAYPSDAPGSPLVLDGTNHGNGYLNTGILDAIDATPQPDKATVSFAKPGTYEYYCVVHGAEMKGSVTVTP